MTLNQLSVSELLENVVSCEVSHNYADLLVYIELLLSKDPENSDYLLYKIKAYKALGTLSKNIDVLQSYIRSKSTDATGFLLLYEVFMEQGYVAGAVLSLVYALSIEPDNAELSSTLFQLLQKIDTNYTRVKINIMTTDRIGHLACEIEPLLRLNVDKNDCLYLFLSTGQNIANHYLYDLIKFHTNVVEDSFFHHLYITRPTLLNDFFFAEYPYDVNSRMRGVKASEINTNGFKNLVNIYQNSEPALVIPEEDVNFGWEFLKNYGITPQEKIVCFHVRDNAYLSGKFPEKNFSYHNFRDADVQTYLPAIEYLIEQGYKVVQIGASTNQKLAIESNHYIDLANNRSEEYGDFLELFLLDICHFFLANFSGPYGVATIFDTPILIVNGTPVQHPYGKFGRFLPKRIFQHGDEIMLPELCRGKPLSNENKAPIYLCFNQVEFTKYGVEYVDNSQEDILKAVIEFEARMEGKTFDMTLTEQQQSYYDALPDDFCHKNYCVVSDSFLSDYVNTNKL